MKRRIKRWLGIVLLVTPALAAPRLWAQSPPPHPPLGVGSSSGINPTGSDTMNNAAGTLGDTRTPAQKRAGQLDNDTPPNLPPARPSPGTLPPGPGPAPSGPTAHQRQSPGF